MWIALPSSPRPVQRPRRGCYGGRHRENSLHLEDDLTFDPTRKGILDPKTLPFEERVALIKENPAYGQIICRCESVTEGEIIDAIHRVPGARSLTA